MKVPPWLAACAIAGSACCLPVAAQLSPSTAPAVTLAHAVDAAWQRAVAAREALGQLQRAAADRAVAASPWAASPALAINHRNDRWQGHAGQHETEIGLTWPLWLPGQRSARVAAADAAILLADGAQAAARLRLAGEVREAAWALLQMQAEAAQAEALVDTLATLSGDVERRVRAGDLARADALAARAEQLGAMVQRTDAHQRVLAARSRWQVLTGLDAGPSAEASAATASIGPELLADHPELRLASAASRWARRRLELQGASLRDAPELSVALRQEVPGRAQASQGSLAIGLRLPLGTADRNQPLRAAALAELDVAQTHEQRLRERLAADVAAALAGQQAAEAQRAGERERSTLLRERARLVELSFRAGESPLPDLLRALAAATQAEAALARQQATLGLAHARLQQALGLLP